MNVLTTPMEKIGAFLNFIRPSFVQTAALCWRPGIEEPEILLVKTLRRGHWIIPKGWPMSRKSLAEAAAIEAWEEAGVTGAIAAESIGAFTYTKIKKSGLPVQCRPQVYILQVAQTEDDYPESSKRIRKWFPLSEASLVVQNPGLKTLLASPHLAEMLTHVK